MSLPTPDARIAELEHLDWTPGCESVHGCTCRANGAFGHPRCRAWRLLCDEHHLRTLAQMADDLADGHKGVRCRFCKERITSLTDVEWRPL